jgi:hypothetical protein
MALWGIHVTRTIILFGRPRRSSANRCVPSLCWETDSSEYGDDACRSISDSQEFAELWVQGGSDFHDLEESRKIRLIFFERRAIVHWHNMFSLRSQGLLSDEDWAELKWTIENLGGRRQSVHEAWKMFRGSFEELYREFLDERLAVAHSAPASG